MLSRRAPRTGLPVPLGSGQIALVLGNRTLRMLVTALMIFGGFACSSGIYQSLIAVTVFGLSDQAYSVVIIVSLMVAVGASVGIGILTDQYPQRRALALMAAASMTIGALLVLAVPTTPVFLLAVAVLFPFSSAIFGQIFAVARLVLAPAPKIERDGVLMVIRASFAAPFILVLPAWSIAFTFSAPLLSIFAGLAVFGAALFFVVARYWPRDAEAPWAEQKSGIGFRASMAEMLRGPVFLRVMLVGAIQIGGAVQGVLVGLVFNAAAGRGTSDVGLYFCLLVIFEVVFTLQVYRVLRHLRRLYVIAAGVLISAVQIAVLPWLADSWAVWLVAIPSGIGGALLYPLAIGYLQDLLGARAGAGSSLIALQRIASDGLAAVVFALGSWIAGYWLVAAMASVVMLVAMAIILWLDRYQPLES